jgi:RNase adaptor protein for sRNA GlmZ degradation
VPAVVASNIEFDDSSYYMDWRELAEVFSHIKEDRDVELYLIGIRNEQNKLVKRFKAVQEASIKKTKNLLACINPEMDTLFILA